MPNCSRRTHKNILQKVKLSTASILVALSLTACGSHYGAAKIVSIPSGAEVINLDDGTVIGNTPVTMRWKNSSGDRQHIPVRLRAPGYYEKVSSFWLSMRHTSEKDAKNNPQLVEITMQKKGE